MATKRSSLSVGIDLGTTHCCVAYMNENKVVDIIANREGYRTTPSYIVLTNQQILVGKMAKEEYFKPPENVVYDSKRLIGRNFDDKYIQNDIKNWTFKVKNRANKPIIELTYDNEPVCYTPEEISAMLLDYIKKFSEEYIGKTVDNAIITVPAHFNYHQRTATMAAGKLAGLNVLGTINEPTAAALAYVHKNNITDSRTILVFDLGGGTFDVSIVKVQSNNVRVIATAGNTHLGGRDFDNNLINFISNKIQERYGEDVIQLEVTKRRIKAASENIKIKLSFVATTILDLQSFHNGEDVEIEITREEFEEINSDLFSYTLDTVQSCLNDAQLIKTDIDDIVLVGGSVKIPKIQQMLSDYFNGKSLSKAINPDEAVAYGAAVYTAKFSNSNKTEAPINVTDVTPLSLGVNCHGSLMSVLIPRNSTIPTVTKSTFYSTKDKQKSRIWHIYEGERTLAYKNIFVGVCRLTMKPHPPGYSADLILEVDENGILHISAQEKSGNHTKLSINYASYDSNNTNDILHDAEVNKVLDTQTQNVIQKWKFLKNYCTKLKAICDYDKFNIISEDKCIIKEIAQKQYNWASIHPVVFGTEEETTLINNKLSELDNICAPLAIKYSFDVKHLKWKEFYELVTGENELQS